MTPEGAAALMTASAAAVGAIWTVIRSARKDAEAHHASTNNAVLSGYNKLVNELQEEIVRLRTDLENERKARERLQEEVSILRRAISERGP